MTNSTDPVRAREILAHVIATEEAKGYAGRFGKDQKHVPEWAALEAIAAALAQQPDDANRLVRELDVALNGPEGAAAQASLCDLVSQVQRIVRERGAPLLAPSAPVGVERLRRMVEKLAAHVRPTCSELWEEAQAALSQQPAPVGALSAIAGHLRLAGAALPAPQVQGTPESGVITGLSIALALVESAIAQQPAAVDRDVAWILLRGSQGEPAGTMTVSAKLQDGSEVVLIRDSGNVIDHAVNLAAALSAQQGGTK